MNKDRLPKSPSTLLLPMRILHRAGFFEASLACVVFISPAMAATLASDGSRADVQTKIDAAVDGDVVTLPAGTFSWTSGVVISGKGVHLRSTETNGGSRIVARSRSSVAVGTGSKTFTLLSARANAPLESYINLKPGDTIRIHRTGGSNSTPFGSSVWMLGTVTSYSAGLLVANITSTSTTTGTHGIWILEAVGATRIVNNAGSSPLVSITEDASDHVELSQIGFEYGTGTGTFIDTNPIANGKPILIHDLGVYNTFPGSTSIYFRATRGIVWNCSFWSNVWTEAPLALQLKAFSQTSSWATPSTMGIADTTGTGNFYAENCDFHTYLNAGDADDNMRAVIRHCLFNNAGFVAHGQDSSAYGMRHVEFYNNELVFDNMSFEGSTTLTFNMNWWLLLRGGTGVITDNTITDINSADYGNRAEFVLQIQNLSRNAWGAGKYAITNITATNPAIITTTAPHTGQTGQKVYLTGTNSTPSLDGSYTMTRLSSTTFSVPVNVTGAGSVGYANPANWPTWRQVGRGYITGTGFDGIGAFVGTDSEPFYIWGNSFGTVGVSDAKESFAPVADRDFGTDYIQAGRDYIIGTPKPGYTKYPHPHPLRGQPRFVQISVVGQ